MAKSDIAFSSEFSPSQVDLVDVLNVLQSTAGNSSALLRAVQAKWFPKAVVAKNLRLSLLAYGIIADGSGPDDKGSKRHERFHLTDAGKRLMALRDNPDALYAEMGRHVLLKVKGGMAVLNVVEDLDASGIAVKMDAVREELVRRGLHIPKNNMAATRVRQWLEKCGVVTPEPHRVVEERKAELLGSSTQEIEALDGLTTEQKAYARALARMNVTEIRSNEVAKFATETFGVRFPDTGLPGAVLEPLKERGLLTYQKTTGGRGAKPAIVRPTAKLNSDVFEPLLEAVEASAGIEYRSFVRAPWADVLHDLRSENKNVKGKALEALAAKLSFVAGLEYRAWRLRGTATGGAEVDLLVESYKPVFLRWIIQCKNTSAVRLDDVAKEVGLAVEMDANVVVVVSTGRFSADAIEHAKSVMKRTNLTVVLMDGRDINSIAKNPAAIFDILHRRAKLAATLKRIDGES